jgi:hypothetical protein
LAVRRLELNKRKAESVAKRLVPAFELCGVDKRSGV